MRPSLSLLLPAIALGGCVELPIRQPWTSCSDFEGGTYEAERTYGVSADELDALLDEDGELSEEACHDLCRANHWMEDQIIEIHSCSVDDNVDGAPAPYGDTADTGLPPFAVTCSWTENQVCEGRAHAALSTHAEGAGPTPLAAWLARAAHAEAASVKAFVSLARELDAHGAPSTLVAACHAAATDEIDHARRMGALAASFGGRPTKPRMGPTPVRTLLELAVENAVEGCVRETWSAMVAHWQALHASEPAVRRLMAHIAADEARHGELAHAIHDWAMTQLDDEGRATVHAARQRAISGLLEGLAEPVDEELAQCAGVPAPQQALYLARQLAQQLWAA